MLSISEAGKRTGLHTKTVRRYVKAGTIQAELLNGQYVIQESELEKLPKPYKKHAEEPATPAKTLNAEEALTLAMQKAVEEGAKAGMRQGAALIASALMKDVQELYSKTERVAAFLAAVDPQTNFP